jgi:hypothetical protein
MATIIMLRSWEFFMIQIGSAFDVVARMISDRRCQAGFERGGPIHGSPQLPLIMQVAVHPVGVARVHRVGIAVRRRLVVARSYDEK